MMNEMDLDDVMMKVVMMVNDNKVWVTVNQRDRCLWVTSNRRSEIGSLL